MISEMIDEIKRNYTDVMSGIKIQEGCDEEILYKIKENMRKGEMKIPEKWAEALRGLYMALYGVGMAYFGSLYIANGVLQQLSSRHPTHNVGEK